MTTNEKVKQIRQRCIANDSSITRLVFGCEVKYEGLIFSVYGGSFGDIRIVYTKGGRMETVYEADIEIIGRPIYIRDILSALDAELPTPFFEDSNDWEIFLFHKWSLPHSLTWHAENRPKTISFLFELLI